MYVSHQVYKILINIYLLIFISIVPIICIMQIVTFMFLPVY